jgi:hypothetical protein
MKLWFRILVLAGMGAMWVLTPVLIPVKAEKLQHESHKEKTPIYLYEGPVQFTAKINRNAPLLKANVQWTATATVTINFPENDLNKKAIIEFPGLQLLLYQLGLSTPGDRCTDIFMFFKNSYPPFDIYGENYLPNEKFFKLHGEIGDSHLEDFIASGYCDAVGDKLKGKLLSGYEEYVKLMDPVNLYIVNRSEDSLKGYCTLPMWELSSYGIDEFTTDCHWEAYRTPFTKVPAWWTITEKRKK